MKLFNKLAKLFLCFVLILASVFAAQYSNTFNMDQPGFSVQAYNCNADSTCSNPSQILNSYTNSNSYTFTFYDEKYYAEYLYKDGYLPYAFTVNKYNGINVLNFVKKENCKAAVNSITVSDSTPEQGDLITVTAVIDSALHGAAQGAPRFRPEEFRNFFDADTNVKLKIIKNGIVAYEVLQSKKVYIDSTETVVFQVVTSAMEGDYIISIETDVVDTMCNQNTKLSSTNSLNIHVDVPTPLQEPIAEAGSDKIICLNENTQFSSLGSYDNDGTIVSYAWNFGDSTAANGAIVNHNYTQIGEYTATLTVTDNDGLQNMDHLQVIVHDCNSDVYPIAIAGPDQTVYVNQLVHFNGSASYDLDGHIVSYEWDVNGDNIIDIFGSNPIYTYNQTGIYNITLLVTDNDGLQDTDVLQITVLPSNQTNQTNLAPISNFTYNPLNPIEEQEVLFNSSLSYDPDGQIVEWSWNFGDGITLSYNFEAPWIGHIYYFPGTYNATLTVTDDDGAQDTKLVQIVVAEDTNQTDLIDPVANFNFTPTNPNEGQIVSFNASNSSDADGTIVSYAWNFGDGNVGSGVNINHTYAQEGIYHMGLTVTDNDGLQDSYSRYVTVGDVIPQVTITASPTTGEEELEVHFNSTVNGNAPFTYLWNFDETHFSTLANPIHTFENAGTYHVRLIVTDNDGDSANATITIHVDSNETDDEDGDNDQDSTAGTNPHSLGIVSIIPDKEKLSPGDRVTLDIQLKNYGSYDENNLKVKISIADLGLEEIYSVNELSPFGATLKQYSLDIPKNAVSGDYNAKVEFYNDYTKAVRYSDLEVQNSDFQIDVTTTNKQGKEIDWLSILEFTFLSLFVLALLIGIYLIVRKLSESN
ncbi:MAG: PKD domain-containing protein [Candidatus Nanoarchaeia archaeon]|nr:PKD domain-containing protein [Candidatus Nanoarchaeia archaeon]MDD5587496.1 PKD domain-containing protein [Candidatus Nanoarchaeia archaeon]